MTSARTTTWWVAVVAVSATALSGCGADRTARAEPPPTTSTAPTTAPATTPAAAPAAEPAPRSTVVSPPPRSRAEQDDLDQQLRAAGWADDVPAARALVERGADVDAQDATGQSAYLVATSEGHLELLEVALGNGATVDAKDRFDGTGLIRAAERGHAAVVGRLLAAGIDRDHVNRSGYQAIHEAVWLGQDTARYVDTVRVLSAGGVQLDRRSGVEGLTPLEMARERGFPALEAALVRALDPAAVTAPDTVLLRAAAAGDADQVARALWAGADVEARDDLQRTALLLAVTEDRVDVARLLVAVGADPDALDHQRDTPWLVTGVTGSVAMLEALLPARPDLTVLNRYGGTSLIPASERGHVAYVRRVLNTGIDVDHVNRLGWTALLEAVVLGDGGRDHQAVVALLLAAGADRSIPDRDGVTALSHARADGHPALVALLTGS